MTIPKELVENRPMELHGGVWSTTTLVWEMLAASASGDHARIQALSKNTPELLTCQYDYTSPIHLAVRGGHLEIVQYLIRHRALDPDCHNHPFLEPIVKIAEDRHHKEIAVALREAIADPSCTQPLTDVGAIKRNLDPEELEFQVHVDQGRVTEASQMLSRRAGLALNDDYFWGEGILAMPAKGQDHEMIELLWSYGARVPDVSKWGARYYFKHLGTGEFLLKKGMNPNHRHWKGFTLLHDFAFTGDLDKCRLLVDYGAALDIVDEEYGLSPLGYAVHFGKSDVAAFLESRA